MAHICFTKVKVKGKVIAKIITPSVHANLLCLIKQTMQLQLDQLSWFRQSFVVPKSSSTTSN